MYNLGACIRPHTVAYLLGLGFQSPTSHFWEGAGKAMPWVSQVFDQTTKTSRIVECEYLVGADGASSTVRRLLEVPMVGPVGLQHLVNVHFTCKDLWLLAGRYPAILYFIFNPEVVGVIVGHNLLEGRLPEGQAVRMLFSPLRAMVLFAAFRVSVKAHCAPHTYMHALHVKTPFHFSILHAPISDPPPLLR